MEMNHWYFLILIDDWYQLIRPQRFPRHFCCASASWVISATSSGDMRLLPVISTFFPSENVGELWGNYGAFQKWGIPKSPWRRDDKGVLPFWETSTWKQHIKHLDFCRKRRSTSSLFDTVEPHISGRRHQLPNVLKTCGDNGIVSLLLTQNGLDMCSLLLTKTD